MPLAKMGLGALAPGAHEPVIQTRTQSGTHQRNQATRPLLDNFSTRTRSDPLDHPWDELVDHFFLHQLAANVDSRCAGGRDPELCNLAVGVELKTVYQAQLLDGSHGDG